MKIDLMSNTVFTDAELNKRFVAELRSKYSENDELYISKLASNNNERIAFKAFRNELHAELVTARLDNTLLKQAIEYEKAIQRLDQYELSKGKLAEPTYEEKPVLDTNSNIACDDLGNIITEQVQVGEMPAIAPIPTTIASVDEQGNTITIPNPVVVKDEAERAEAQTIINNASVEVLNLVSKRKQV